MRKDLITSYIRYKYNLKPDILIIQHFSQQSSQKYCLDIFKNKGYKIATHLSYRPNFINYTYREEMIGDGIENCIQYAKNFDPEKSKNPFAYFTQIIYYAFLRRISKEKKQQSIKQKMIDNDTLKTHETMDFDDEVYDNTYIDFLKDNLPQEEFPKKKKKTKRGIEHFVEE